MPQNITPLEIVAGGALVFLLYSFIIVRWQRGFYLLIAYTPFAGAVTLALHLWQPSLVFKDVLFVIPIYIGFIAELVVHRDLVKGFPPSIVFLMLGLVLLAAVQSENAGVVNRMMALIGLKVWLFYLPLTFIAHAYLDSTKKLLGLCRLLVVLSFLPTAVSIVQLVMAQSFGYQTAMQASYGEVAAQVTQLFTSWHFGTVVLGRIPSIFTFVTQFFGFSLSVLVPSYIVWRTDTSRRWRLAGFLAFVAAAGATFMSGSRTAFVFTPMIVALIFALDRGLTGLLKGIGSGLLIAWMVLAGLFGIAIMDVYGLVGELFTHYAREVAYGGLIQALQLAPLGMGTGTNTGAARYALEDPTGFVGIENYYAKAVYELGLPGLVIVAGLFAAIIVLGFNVRARARFGELRCCASAFLAFFIVMFFNSFKGWLVDLDPVNVYYWVFCGLLLKLPALEAGALRQWRATDPRAAQLLAATSRQFRSFDPRRRSAGTGWTLPPLYNQ
jgi:hypothetical protein